MIGVLVDELGSQEAAARALGKSPTWLSKRKRVLAAPALAAAVERGEISLDHAYDLVTRSPDERTALAHLGRIRAGDQNQGTTRDVLAPRQRPAGASATSVPPLPAPVPAPPHPGGPTEAPGRISDRNLGGPETGARAVSDRDPAVPAGESPAAQTSSISVRNRMTAEVRSSTGDGQDGDTIELDTLATVRLAHARAGRVPRQAVLRALRADLAALGE